MTPDEISAAVLRDFKEVATGSLDDVVAPKDFKRAFGSGPNGVLGNHALHAVRFADKAQTFDLGETDVILTTRSAAGGARYSVGTVIGNHGDGTRAIETAFRIPQTVAPEPLEAFAAFVSRFGRDVLFGGLVRARFVTRLSIPSFDNRVQPVEIGEVTGRSEISVLTRARMNQGKLNITWGYAVDLGEYLHARL